MLGPFRGGGRSSALEDPRLARGSPASPPAGMTIATAPDLGLQAPW